MRLGSKTMVCFLWHVMSVDIQFARHVMSMREAKATRVVLSATLDTSVTKVIYNNNIVSIFKIHWFFAPNEFEHARRQYLVQYGWQCGQVVVATTAAPPIGDRHLTTLSTKLYKYCTNRIIQINLWEVGFDPVGCPRVVGDEEDNYDEDFEDEFQLNKVNINWVMISCRSWAIQYEQLINSFHIFLLNLYVILNSFSCFMNKKFQIIFLINFNFLYI